MSLLTISLSTGIEISADTCHVSVMDYPTDSAENVQKAYLYPVSPEFYEGIPYVVIECEPAHQRESGLRLPNYRMMAMFTSVPLEGHLPEPQPTQSDASFLTIIWLQDDSNPFVSQENLTRISLLDWPTLAKNGNW